MIPGAGGQQQMWVLIFGVLSCYCEAPTARQTPRTNIFQIINAASKAQMITCNESFEFESLCLIELN